MTIQERINKLLKARNLLHAQEEGKEVTSLDITMAHDIIDIVIDDMVDEEFHQSMEKARKGMEAPQIQIYEGASVEQIQLISDINWLLNGANHTLEIPIVMVKENGFEFECSKIEYGTGMLWMVKCDACGNPDEMCNIDRMSTESLDELYGQLIDEII